MCKKDAPVWEIIGTEFSKADAHTANGISIRFPRVKCVRDKSWKQSTTLKDLQRLYDLSKNTATRVGLEVIKTTQNKEDSSSPRTPEKSPEKNTQSSKSLKRSSEENTTPSKKMREKNSSDSTPKSSKRLSEENVSPPKKAKKSDSEKFVSKKSPLSDESSNNILCDVFNGVKLSIPSSLKDSDVLRRYFIAYGGTLLKESEVDEANVVIVTDKDSMMISKKADKVTVDWLWACIKLKKKLPTKLFKSK